jgi:hypothetical protein
MRRLLKRLCLAVPLVDRILFAVWEFYENEIRR